MTSLPRVPVLLLLAQLGCASSQYPDIDEPMPAGAVTTLDSPAVASAAATPVFGPAGTLERAAVERVVDAGLGAFLSHIELEPSLSAGAFRGWRVVRLEPPELWSGVDLQPGDVLTRVNGLGIERELQAFEAFQAVRQADKLEVSYLREGRPRTLSYVIAGKPSAALPERTRAAKPAREPAAVPASVAVPVSVPLKP